MYKKIKLLKDWSDPADSTKSFKAGHVLEVNETAYTAIMANAGLAEDLKQDSPVDAQTIKQIADQVVKAIKIDNTTVKPRIEIVHEPAEDGFMNLGEQMKAAYDFAHGKGVDKRQESLPAQMKAYCAAKGIRTKAPLGSNEIIDSEGGFLVKPEIQDELWRYVVETGKLMDECQTIPIGDGFNRMVWNSVDETSRATGSRFGGLQVYWVNEAGTPSYVKPKFRRNQLELQKLAGLYPATEELMEDAVALTAEVESWFGEEFGWMIDDAILNGGGGGMPLGILNSPALVKVTKETNQTAATIVAENVEKMVAQMWMSSFPKSKWYIQQNIWPQLFQLKHIVGTSGVPVFVPPSGGGSVYSLAEAPYGTLFGRPIEVMEQSKTLGTVGDILLADLSQYRFIHKGSMKTDFSMHVAFITFENVFRFSLRCNGQPLWATSITPANSSLPLSPFVALSTRA